MERGLPASIEIAWGIRERSGKGPKRGLSLSQIVEAAVDVASSEGLAAVSMSRVATELGVATMSLYRYVATKDELLALMVDAAFPTPAAPVPRERWRAALSRWACEHLAVLRRHPWVVRVPLSGPPITPSQVVWFERGLWSLRNTGLTEEEKVSVLLLVNGFVRNEALLKADLQLAAGAGSTMADAMSSYGRLLSRLVDPVRFPAISAAIASGIFDQQDEADADFTFGLERILDGVDALVRQRQKSGARGASSG
jgi:AcrR family transcriptional regulator